MKRFTYSVTSLLLSVEAVSASDTTGALILVPVGGAMVGLALATAFCVLFSSREGRRRYVWFTLPLFAMVGFMIGIGALRGAMSKYESKVVCSFGRYDRLRGGMGVQPVPHTFAMKDVEQVYSSLTNRTNALLAPYEFAVALVHQANGIDQLYFNVYPSLETPQPYIQVDGEVHRQAGIIIARHLRSVGGHRYE
jgi:hypothetical protein